MRDLIFCHGFGFDKNFWKNLSPFFHKERCTYCDLGYFSDNSKMSIEGNNTRPTVRIGIAHSLGLLKLLMLKKKFDYLIGLNSFINFLGYDPALRNRREQALNILKDHFIKSPHNTLKKFYRRCGIPSFPTEIEKINLPKLLDDLEWLKTRFEGVMSAKLLLIGATDDSIVPPMILQDNFANRSNVTIELLHQGRHGLGFLEARAVSDKIIGFINDGK